MEREWRSWHVSTHVIVVEQVYVYADPTRDNTISTQQGGGMEKGRERERDPTELGGEGEARDGEDGSRKNIYIATLVSLSPLGNDSLGKRQAPSHLHPGTRYGWLPHSPEAQYHQSDHGSTTLGPR